MKAGIASRRGIGDGTPFVAGELDCTCLTTCLTHTSDRRGRAMKTTLWIVVLAMFTAACGSGPTQPGLEDVGSENGASLLNDMVQPPGDEGSNAEAVAAGI